MSTLILPDLHGRVEVLEAILEDAGSVDDVVSVGDLIHGGPNTIKSDQAILRMAEDLIDVIVMGNHEQAFLGGARFRGCDSAATIAPTLMELEADGILREVHLVGPYLITHAGLGITQVTYDPTEDDGLDVYDQLCDIAASPRALKFSEYAASDSYGRVFLACGRARGGRDGYGGVTWRDDSEPLLDIPQVYGHTPHGVAWHGESHTQVCIDCGVVLQTKHYAYAVIHDDGSLEVTEVHDGPDPLDR